MTTISEKTKIPLFVVVASLPFAVGGIFWLSSVDAKASKAAESAVVILEIKERVIKIEKDIEYMKERQ